MEASIVLEATILRRDCGRPFIAVWKNFIKSLELTNKLIGSTHT